MPTKLDLARYEARHGVGQIAAFQIDGWTHSDNRQVQDIAREIERFSQLCDVIAEDLKFSRSARSRKLYTRLDKLREYVERMVADTAQFSDEQYEGTFSQVVGYVDGCRSVLQGLAFASGADPEKYQYDTSDYKDWESWLSKEN